MKVHDIEIPEAAEARALTLLRERPTGVAYSDVISVMYGPTVEVWEKHKAANPDYRESISAVAGRAADRLLQRERKAGRLAYAGGKWHWVGQPG